MSREYRERWPARLTADASERAGLTFRQTLLGARVRPAKFRALAGGCLT